MPRAVSIDVINRLWKLLDLMIQGVERSKLPEIMGYTPPSLAADINKLKKLGLDIRHSRNTDTYTVSFPEAKQISVKLNRREFFFIYAVIKSAESEVMSAFSDVVQKMDIAFSTEGSPIYDVGPAYGIGQNITAEITDLLQSLCDAIASRRKAVFIYEKSDSTSDLRVTHPYKLIHTPISWYLIAYCEGKKDFRKFKLARMSQLRILEDKFKRRDFNLKDQLGDAWWLQFDPERLDDPYIVKVLFKGESANAIREYKFHDTQELETTPEGTIATWRLSYLNEFATWLMQWVGSIEILEPNRLKEIIGEQIKLFEDQHAGVDADE